MLAVDDDDARETEVQGASEEGGSDCYGDEIAMRAVRIVFSILEGIQGCLHNEIVEVKWIVM